MAQTRRFLQGRRIDPRPISGSDSVGDLIDNAFLAYNAARLREACRLFNEKMLAANVTIALPLITAYALSKHPTRPLKRLYDRRAALIEALKSEHEQALTKRQEATL